MYCLDSAIYNKRLIALYIIRSVKIEKDHQGDWRRTVVSD